MRERERKVERIRLDREMRPYRRAATEKEPTNELLRAVRQALRVPVGEIAGKLGVGRSMVFEFEMREGRKTITLRSLGRVAEAMGCKVVYGIVPKDGKTLEMLAEERLWRAVLEKQGEEARVEGPPSRVQGPGSRVEGPGSRVKGPGSRVQGPESGVQRLGNRD